MTKVAVVICTAGRPVMLGGCLRSVIAQSLPADLAAEVIVVDNNPAPSVEAIVSAAAAGAPFPVRAVHEPEPGISPARNRGVEEALQSGADWIAFIDDDETAEPGWLAALIAAAGAFKADVVQGKLVKVYPDRLPWFVRASNHGPRSEGKELQTAYTHNVAFAAWLVEPARGGLRFDFSLRFVGGEDTLFFRQAHKIGARIVATERSVVKEVQPPERLTVGWQFARNHRIGASMARTESLLDIPARERKQTPPKLAFRILRSAVVILLSPLTLVMGARRFSDTVGKALAVMAQAMGGFSGRRGELPTPYRRTDGY